MFRLSKWLVYITIRVVKLNSRLISVFLLGIFSFSLVSELAVYHGDWSSTELQVSRTQNNQTQSPSVPQNPCDDACQVGQCHFGHCSFVNFPQISVGAIVPVFVGFNRSDSFDFQPSYSEQPTRPPRLS